MAYQPPAGGKAPEVNQAPQTPVKWTPVQAASTEGTGYTRTLIIGQAGFGKTRLAATWPDPLILDYDNGAGSANARRLLMPRDGTAIVALRQFTQAALNYKLVDGAFTMRAPNGEVVSFHTLVIDTLDSCQQPAKQHLLGDRFQMEQRDWGKLGDWMRPALEPLIALPMHLVFVVHQSKVTPMKWSDKGFIGMAIQGALKEALLGMCDLALNMVGDSTGQRRVYVRPVVTNLAGRSYDVVAKDRHNWFAGVKGVGVDGCFTWVASPSGYPDNKLAQFICGHGITAEPIAVLDNTTELAPEPEVEEPNG